MANPQIENGHIDIANEIAEELYRLQISGSQWRILWVILRQTYGWHKRNERISLSFFQEKTKIKSRHVSRALKDLTEREIIAKNDTTTITTYGLQKDYTLWVLSPKLGLPKIGTTPPPKLGLLPPPKLGLLPPPKLGLLPPPKLGLIKETKETIKETKRKEKATVAEDIFSYYAVSLQKKRKPIFTAIRKALITKRLQEGYTSDDLKTAINNFVKDGWGIKNGYTDLIYVIGQQKGKRDNLEHFLDWQPPQKDASQQEEHSS